jgi:hypothetical protein
MNQQTLGENFRLIRSSQPQPIPIVKAIGIFIMDPCKKITMVGFIWSLVKCLPAPFLFGVGAMLGLLALWLVAQLGGLAALGVLVLLCGGGLGWAIFFVAKDENRPTQRPLDRG